MKIPLQIEFRHFAESPALRALVGAQLARVERLFDDLVRCTVTLDLEQRRRHNGKPLSVAVHITRPGTEIDVRTVGDAMQAYGTVRRSFDLARRRLCESRRAQLHDVRHAAGHHRFASVNPIGEGHEQH